MDKIDVSSYPKLRQWARKVKIKSSHYRNFFTSLLCHDFQKYFYYRLKSFTLSNLLKLVLHVFEFFLFFLFLEKQDIYLLVYFKFTVFIIFQFWWGVLETQRERIRDLFDSKGIFSKSFSVSDWNWIALFYNVLTILAFAFYYYFFLKKAASNFVILYFCASVLIHVIAIQVRTLHSFVYSIRRVYFPMWSILIKEIFYILFLVLTFKSLGKYSLVLSLFASSLISLGVNLSLVKSTFKKVGLKFGLLRLRKSAFQEGCILFSLKGFNYGLSFSLMRLLSLAPFFLFSSREYYYYNIQENYIFFFYLLSPLISMSYNWSKLFYFDFKLLDNIVYSRFQSILLRKLFSLSLLLAFSIFCFCFIIAATLMPNLDYMMVALVSFFYVLSMSMSSYYTMYLFSSERLKLLYLFIGFCFLSIIFHFALELDPRAKVVSFFLTQLIFTLSLMAYDKFNFEFFGKNRLFQKSFLSFFKAAQAYNHSCSVFVINFEFEESEVKLGSLLSFQKDLKRRYKEVKAVGVYQDKLLILSDQVNLNFALASLRFDLIVSIQKKGGTPLCAIRDILTNRSGHKNDSIFDEISQKAICNLGAGKLIGSDFVKNIPLRKLVEKSLINLDVSVFETYAVLSLCNGVELSLVQVFDLRKVNIKLLREYLVNHNIIRNFYNE